MWLIKWKDKIPEPPISFTLQIISIVPCRDLRKIKIDFTRGTNNLDNDKNHLLEIYRFVSRK